jgi:hypothetical protein
LPTNMREAETQWAQLSRLLALRVTIAVPDWVRRSVERGLTNAVEASAGRWSLPDDTRPFLARGSEAAGWRAADAIACELGSQLRTDPESQPSVPEGLLHLLQSAVRYPAGVLQLAGVPHARRDRAIMKLFPSDVYAIVPRSLAELHPFIPELAQTCEQARLRVIVQRFATALR